MSYSKVYVTSNISPKRLNRTLLIKQNISIFEAGVAILASFGATFEHYFLIKDSNRIEYAERDFLIENPEGLEGMEGHKFNKLGNKFSIEYDTGESYKFKVVVKKKDIKMKSKELVIFKDGKGIGIFEDNRQTLEGYINGKVSGDFTKKDENDTCEYYMPWNFEEDMEKLSDFDKPLKKEDYENLNDEVEFNLNSLKMVGRTG